MDYQNSQLVSFIHKSIKTYAKSKRAVSAKSDPLFSLERVNWPTRGKGSRGYFRDYPTLKNVEGMGWSDGRYGGNHVKSTIQANIYKGITSQRSNCLKSQRA